MQGSFLAAVSPAISFANFKFNALALPGRGRFEVLRIVGRAGITIRLFVYSFPRTVGTCLAG